MAKCPKCKSDTFELKGMVERCDKCLYVEHLDFTVLDRIKPIDLHRWFDNLDTKIREGRFF